MRDTLIVVDMQNDFITGSLGSEDAQAIVGNVKNKIREYYDAGKEIIFTKDTHFKKYLSTLEGKKLPIEHCIFGTNGWYLSEDILDGIDGDNPNIIVVNKNSFGYTDFRSMMFDADNTFEICGLCTDICVISNALIIRTLYNNSEITVDAKCCAGTSKEKHNAALDVMESCQIDVINRE